MKIKEHGHWGHGLRDDQDHDINCVACVRERRESKERP